MLTRLIETKALQRLADRLGLTFWEKFLIFRHDMSAQDKARRIFKRREDPFSYKSSAYEQERFDRMEEFLKDRGDGRALELACAEGAFTRRLAARCKQVVALDVSQRALDRAKSAVASEKVTWIQANARNWHAPGKFDVVVLGDFIYYLGDPAKGPAFSRALDAFNQKVVSWLEDGGVILLANAYGTDSDLKRNQDYAARFERLGMRKLKSVVSGQGAHDKGGVRCLIELLEKPKK